MSQFQLIHYSSYSRCYVYPNRGYSAGYPGNSAYDIVVKDVVTSTTRQITWEPRSGNEAIGAHCCATGYECTDCAVGKYSDEVGLLACKLCQNAKYMDQTAAIECKNCPVGRKGSGLAKVYASECTNCETGKYNDEPGTHPCKDCALGKYNEATQSVSIDACLDCAKGKYAPVVGTTTCTNCEPGRYQNSIGQSNCINCNPGKYAGAYGWVECNNCPTGQWQSSSGKSSCIKCAAGRYNGNTGSTDSSACIACSGAVCSGEGAAACAPATPGYYTNSAKHCTACGGGQYQNQHGTTGCKNCPLADIKIKMPKLVVNIVQRVNIKSKWPFKL